jgi:hypothetical protein
MTSRGKNTLWEFMFGERFAPNVALISTSCPSIPVKSSREYTVPNDATGHTYPTNSTKSENSTERPDLRRTLKDGDNIAETGETGLNRKESASDAEIGTICSRIASVPLADKNSRITNGSD